MKAEIIIIMQYRSSIVPAKQRRGHQHQRGVLIDVAAPHPFYEAVSALLRRDHELLVAGLGLAEGLDDLNAIDVLYRGIVQRLGFDHRVLIALLAAPHHQGEEEQTHRNRDQRQQR